MNLFDEADAHAAALRRVPRYCDADLEVLFRQVQRRCLPDLPDSEFQTLYGVWRDRHDGSWALQRQAQAAQMQKLVARHQRLCLARHRATTAAMQQALDGLLRELGLQIAGLLAPRGGREPLPGDATWPDGGDD